MSAWDISGGLRFPGLKNPPALENSGGDPLAPVRALPALAAENGSGLLLLHNYHRFFQNPEVVQTVFNALLAGKQQRTFVVIFSPVVQIPPELEKMMVVIEHPLPDRQQLEHIARELLSDSQTTCLVAPPWTGCSTRPLA